MLEDTTGGDTAQTNIKINTNKQLGATGQR